MNILEKIERAMDIDQQRLNGFDDCIEPKDYCDCSNPQVTYRQIRTLIRKEILRGNYTDNCPTSGFPGYFRIDGLGPNFSSFIRKLDEAAGMPVLD